MWSFCWATVLFFRFSFFDFSFFDRGTSAFFDWAPDLSASAFSPARVSSGLPGWYALGPVAVVPNRQRTGIGSVLVRAGLEVVSELGATGCILTGNAAFYSRFGFEPAPESAPSGEPQEFFMVKLLRGQLPVGSIHFHEAFGGAV